MRFEEEAIAESPQWLQFTLKNQVYAINISRITSILQMPESITHVPDFPGYVRGLLDMRGDLIPVVDMRIFLGMPAISKEQDAFYHMLDARKQDHINWMKELNLSYKEHRPFTLATDPTKCAFGKWYYSFKDSEELNNSSVSFHLGKLEEPHANLHAVALELERCKEDFSGSELDERIEAIMERLYSEYVPTVLRLIDEAKEIFSGSYREMCVVLKDESASVGLIVDQVLEVGDLTIVNQPNEAGMTVGAAVSGFIAGVGKADGRDVLLLHDETLFNALAHVAGSVS